MIRRSPRRRFVGAALLAGLLLVAACGTRVTDTISAGSTGAASSGTGTGAGTGTGTAGTGDGATVGAGTGDATGTDGASGAETGGGGGTTTGGGGTTTGGGDAGGGNSFDVPDGNAQGVSDTEIKVGLSIPLSGVLGFAGNEVTGAIDSYFQATNAKGGVNGRKLRLISYDDRLDNSQTLTNVRRLWEQDKVHAIFLLTGTGVLDYATGNGIPLFVFGGTPEGFATKYDTTFPMVGNVLIWTQEVIAGLKSVGVFKPGMRVGMLYDSGFLDVSPYLPYLKAAWTDAGATVVSTDPFNLTDGDCTSLVLKMKSLNIDYWDFQGLGWVLCASAAARQQYRPPMGWGNWPTSIAGLATQVGPWVDGIWGGAQGDQATGAPRQKTAATDEYINAITRYHPNIATPGDFESPVTIGYWVGSKLLAHVLGMQKNPTTEGTIKAAASLKEWDAGITPPIHSLSSDCKTGSEVVWIGQWKWDGAKKQATRTPATGYFTSPDKDKYGGKCFLTIISNKLVGD